MSRITIPALTVHLGAANDENVTLTTGSICCVAAFPSAAAKQITILPMDTNGKFHLPEAKVELLQDPNVTASKLDCGVMFRFAAPGQQLPDPIGLATGQKIAGGCVLSAEQKLSINESVSIHQHVVTEFVSLQNMLDTLCTGADFTQPAHTLEDDQKFLARFSLTQKTKASMSTCTEALKDVRAHVKKLEFAHGEPLLSAENLVKIAMEGKADRQQRIQDTTGALFGQSQGPADWNLRASRAAPGLQIDMHMSDKIREGAMQANMPAYMQTLALNLGGMLANITQRFNGDLSSEMSTTNALQLWTQATTKEQMKQEYATCVERNTVCMNTYLPDPAWVSTNGKIEISQGIAGEDQEMCGGKAVETIATSAEMGTTQIFGDCEDSAAQNAAQLSLMQMPRTELSTRLGAALSMIPVHFSKSPAKTDYTHLAPHITSLALTLRDAYACKNTPIKTVETREQMLVCMKENLNSTSDLLTHVATAALVASAPKLQCNLETATQLSNEMESIGSYTSNWQDKLTPEKQETAGWMGHSTCAELRTIPICEYKGVVVHAVQDVGILEGTSCAYKLRGENTLVNMNFLTQRSTPMRQHVQQQLNENNRPLSTVMALNLGATVLATELRTALHETGNMQNVNASQVYKLNSTSSNTCIDGTFYRCLVTAGKLECATVDLPTSQLYPGIPLDVKQIPKTMHLAFEARMKPPEAEACVLLGGLMSLGRCSDGQAAINAPDLSPLQVRQSLISKSTAMAFSTPTVTLAAQSAVDVHKATEGNVMGCVLKTVGTAGEASTTSLQNSAQAIATTARQVYGADTTIAFSAFTSAMILTVPV
jgi:hypothetical protein